MNPMPFLLARRASAFHTRNQSSRWGLAPRKEPPVLPSCFWVWFSPGQEQVGNRCESPIKKRWEKRGVQTQPFLCCRTPQNPGKSLKRCLFVIKVEEENFIPLSFVCHCLLLLFLISSDLYPTAAHTRMCFLL